MKIVILGAGAYELAPALLDDLFVQTHTAVSYTHLDVYKRQPFAFPSISRVMHPEG